MKGTIFDGSIEIQVETQGEQWQQGDKFKGAFRVQNRGKDTVKLDAMGVALSYVDLKKIKKAEDGFCKILNQIDFGLISLKSGEKCELPWSFDLDENFYITDKKMCPYLFYGNLKKKLPASLALKVEPHQVIKKVIEMWEVFFKFQCKEICSKKDQSLEIKLTSPDAKDFLTLDSFQMTVHRKDELLHWDYAAKKKTLAMLPAGMSIKLEDVVMSQDWLPKKYQLMPGHLDQEFVKSEINKVLEPLRKKSL